MQFARVRASAGAPLPAGARRTSASSFAAVSGPAARWVAVTLGSAPRSLAITTVTKRPASTGTSTRVRARAIGGSVKAGRDEHRGLRARLRGARPAALRVPGLSDARPRARRGHHGRHLRPRAADELAVRPPPGEPEDVGVLDRPQRAARPPAPGRRRAARDG